jgi:hypothetical protein
MVILNPHRDQLRGHGGGGNHRDFMALPPPPPPTRSTRPDLVASTRFVNLPRVLTAATLPRNFGNQQPKGIRRLSRLGTTSTAASEIPPMQLPSPPDTPSFALSALVCVVIINCVLQFWPFRVRKL